MENNQKQFLQSRLDYYLRKRDKHVFASELWSMNQLVINELEFLIKTSEHYEKYS